MATAVRAADSDIVTTLPKVEVIATTPLANAVDRDHAASAAQSVNAEQIERSNALSLGEYLNRRLAGVFVNDVQNNPLQPDLNYRGYTASPLLGTPQGLAVYLDGVRLNQPFGDVVSWDLIPETAIADITLLPGSNPLFGLNALGGALSIHTKDGFANAGTQLRVGYGSFARRSINAAYGDHTEQGAHWFVAGQAFHEDGWRAASPSETQQIFGKLGWRGTRSDIALTAAYADSTLTGNGMQEFRLLQDDYASYYTKPDITDNRSAMTSLLWSHRLADKLSLSGTAFYRDIATRSFNGDLNEEALAADPYQPNSAEQTALTDAGYTGFPSSGENSSNTPFPYWRCIANALLNEEPNEVCNGLANRTHTNQHIAGASAELNWQNSIVGRANRLTVGAAFDQSRAEFSQSTQFAYLNADRSVVAVSGPGAFADGTQNSDDAYDARVALIGHTRTVSAYFSDLLALSDAWHLTLSGQYFRVAVATQDLLTPAGQNGSLDAAHRFSHFNPALGVVGRIAPTVNAYASYGRSSRAPSAVELGCADPDNPCRLPNAMAGDPPLNQVVAATVEFGMRSTSTASIDWAVSLFRTDNSDDILFVADDQTGFGYFTNVDRTRRQGLELSVGKQLGPLNIGVNYAYLRATFASAETVGGAGNSHNADAAEGNPGLESTIEIAPGNRVPLIPEQTAKLFARLTLRPTLSVSGDLLAVSSMYARGNENNLHEPDGTYYLGSGKTAGYAVFNLGAEYRPTPPVAFFIQLNNVLDRRYATAAQLGPTGISTDGSFVAQPFGAPTNGEPPIVHSTFYSPGAPRSVWLGVKYAVGKLSE